MIDQLIYRTRLLTKQRGFSLLLIFPVLCVSSCAKQPWVRPYDRLNLAEPVMIMDRNPVASTYMHHVFQAREGARGAEGGMGGGCGCN